MQKAIRRNITSCSSKTKRAFFGLETVEKRKGEMPEMLRFPEFWGAKRANTKYAKDGRGES